MTLVKKKLVKVSLVKMTLVKMNQVKIYRPTNQVKPNVKEF